MLQGTQKAPNANDALVSLELSAPNEKKINYSRRVALRGKKKKKGKAFDESFFWGCVTTATTTTEQGWMNYARVLTRVGIDGWRDGDVLDFVRNFSSRSTRTGEGREKSFTP